MAGEIFDYFAFISYSHEDKETAQKLQKRLERYHMPAKLLQAHPELPKKLSPIFRDESDIAGKGTLIETLHDNLKRSQYLILICSPSSAKSEYVNDEVDYFINELHREDKIIPLIVGGIPRSKDESIECFPPAILALDREHEPLGIDLKTFGRDGAFLRVIAAMLRLNFTYFKLREDEERKRRLMMFTPIVIAFSLLLCVLAWYSINSFNFFNEKDTNAQIAIGLTYIFKKDYAQAIEWFKKSVVQGDEKAVLMIEFMYDKGFLIDKDYSDVMELYRKARSADQGNADAQLNIGYMYDQGLLVEQDYSKAMEWYKKAAMQGDAEAQYRIADMYYRGLGVEQDYSEAKEWYQKAASNDYVFAQVALGYVYDQGLGVKQDYSKAVEWYQKAVAQGNTDAQYNLGIMYLHGLGVPQSSDKAIEYFTQAAQQGDNDAKSELQKLSR